mmetsp:Transcript_3692/g.7900  ORF Transcript_3692/g.7900 Transcript_3692/m.7900 type:complete len:216 (-) Transcript_3692:737-1384(-)
MKRVRAASLTRARAGTPNPRIRTHASEHPEGSSIPVPTCLHRDRPLLEPGDGVQPLARELCAAVHDLVVVHEHDVALLHRNVHEVAHRRLVNRAQVLLGNLTQIAVKHIRTVKLRRARRLRQVAVALVAQITRVRVHVAEPRRQARLWVPVDRGLRRREGKQAQAVLLVLVPAQLKLHVDLRANRQLGDALKDWLQHWLEGTGIAQKIEERELGI